MPPKPLQTGRENTGASPLIHDIKDPFPYTGLPPFTLTGCVLILALITAAIFRYVSSRPSGTKPADRDDRESPDSFERLSREYRHGLVATDELFNRLSTVMISGLALRAGVSMPSRTDALTPHELLAALSGSQGFSQLNKNRAAEVLLLCDRVNYDRYQPTEAEIAAALDTAVVVMASEIEAGQ